MSSEPIDDFILATEGNLSIAAAVAEAWPRARRRLVTDFLTRLQGAMQKKLKGWQFELYRDFFTDPYPSFLLWKPQWADQYYVTLECYDYGEKMIIGVSRDEDHIKGRPFSAELLPAIRQAFPAARARRWWEADITMQTPAKDWRKPEVLWRMHKDEKFLEEVAGQLLEIATISEPIIDRLVRKQSKGE